MRLTLALDDTPFDELVRASRCGERASITNPTPGLAGCPSVYGARLRRPSRARRPPGVVSRRFITAVGPALRPGKQDLRRASIRRASARHSAPSLNRPSHCCRWAKTWRGLMGLPIRVVADGAYAKADFLGPAKALGMTVVSRLRKDATLRTLPGPRPAAKPRPKDMDLNRRAVDPRVVRPFHELDLTQSFTRPSGLLRQSNVRRRMATAFRSPPSQLHPVPRDARQVLGALQDESNPGGSALRLLSASIL